MRPRSTPTMTRSISTGSRCTSRRSSVLHPSRFGHLLCLRAPRHPRWAPWCGVCSRVATLPSPPTCHRRRVEVAQSDPQVRPAPLALKALQVHPLLAPQARLDRQESQDQLGLRVQPMARPGQRGPLVPPEPLVPLDCPDPQDRPRRSRVRLDPQDRPAPRVQPVAPLDPPVLKARPVRPTSRGSRPPRWRDRPTPSLTI
jgi:hypothetical protein